jgi:hypothetical protein
MDLSLGVAIGSSIQVRLVSDGKITTVLSYPSHDIVLCLTRVCCADARQE